MIQKHTFLKCFVLFELFILLIGYSILPTLTVQAQELPVIPFFSDYEYRNHILFVDDDSPCPGNGTKAWPYCTIRSAVDNASTGDMIYVFSGTYYETAIVINKPLLLQGENRESTIIDAQGEIWTFMLYTVADNITITGFTIQDYGYESAGIYCAGNDNIISDNIIQTRFWEDNGNIIGLSLDYDRAIVKNNKILNNTIGIQVYGSGNHIQGNTLLDNNRYSLYVMSNNNHILDNYILNTVTTDLHFKPASISLFIASNNTIQGNTVIENTYNPNLVFFGIGGIFTEPCRDNRIESNVFKAYNSDCIQLKSIYVPGVDNNTFVNNSFQSQYHHGIFFDNDILRTKVYNNVFDSCGIAMSGNTITFSSQEIPFNNTVNNKPIYYYKNQNLHNTTVPSDAGEVIIGNCSWLTLEGLELGQGSSGIVCGYSSHITIIDSLISKSNDHGIMLFNTSHSVLSRNTIEGCGAAGLYIESVEFLPPSPPSSTGSSYNSISNNIICDNFDGLYLSGAAAHLVTENRITNNSRVGIKLDAASIENHIRNNLISHNGIFLGYGIDISGSSNNIIQRNTITNNGYLYSGGILLQSNEAGVPHENTIKENLIANSTYGMYIYDMYGAGPYDHTLIFHNNFLNNTIHAHDECVDLWDNGYPSGGNYWDNYTGTDANHDGIGDVAFTIAGGDNQDRYPLMQFFKPDTTPPFISLHKPKAGTLYIFDTAIMKRLLSPTPLIIERITVEVNATDNESGIDRIEFYIDDVLQGNDTSSPYEWTWKTRVFFSHTLKVIAYNTEELNTSVSLRVMKFF